MIVKPNGRPRTPFDEQLLRSLVAAGHGQIAISAEMGVSPTCTIARMKRLGLTTVLQRAYAQARELYAEEQAAHAQAHKELRETLTQEHA